ncbi:MAG TPA: hypothetical protein VN665_01720 [Candidatus Paceibacterota bacterium]|nr:hypothetical protein [Candidatus Paceibacterota bacterium]
MTKHSYVFDPGDRSILAEIFLPKRISLQGTLYQTLEDGLNYSEVKKYLVTQAASLKQDYLKAYAEWFEPTRYGYKNKRGVKSSGNPARDRVRRCKRVFFGWSTYEVNGVFLKKNMRDIDEEQTQVIRIIFKYEVPKELKGRIHPEVSRAILYWVVSTYGLTDGKAWGEDKFPQFIERFPHWSEKQKAYAKKKFVALANDINIWIDDCGIFIFGFVLHRLWNKIVEMNKRGEKIRRNDARKLNKNKKYKPAPRKRTHLEDEIWVTSIFRYDVNVSKSK